MYGLCFDGCIASGESSPYIFFLSYNSLCHTASPYGLLPLVCLISGLFLNPGLLASRLYM